MPTTHYSCTDSLLSLHASAVDELRVYETTFTLQRERCKPESNAQVCFPEYMKSIQQIPAGFAIFTIPLDKFSTLEILSYHLLSAMQLNRALLARRFLSHFFRNSWAGYTSTQVKKKMSSVLIFLCH